MKVKVDDKWTIMTGRLGHRLLVHKGCLYSYVLTQDYYLNGHPCKVCKKPVPQDVINKVHWILGIQ